MQPRNACQNSTPGSNKSTTGRLASGRELSQAATSRAPRSRSRKEVTSSTRSRPDSRRYVKLRDEVLVLEQGRRVGHTGGGDEGGRAGHVRVRILVDGCAGFTITQWP